MDERTKTILMVAILIIFFIALGFECLWIRKRRKERLKNLREGVGKDDAHNAIVTTRNLIRVFSERGVNTAKAESILIMASHHLEDRDFPGAKRYADMARKALMEAKKEHDVAAEQREGEDEVKVPSAGGETQRPISSVLKDYEINPPEDDDPAAMTYTGTKLLTEKFPPNYLEARFTMTSAREMISDAEGRGEDMSLARHFLKKAEGHFDAGRLTDSLSFAAKAKKAVEGAEILVKQSEMDEITAMFDSSMLKMVRVLEVDNEVDKKVGEEGDKKEADVGEEGMSGGKSDEEVGTTEVCPKCGHPVEPGDRFCPYCGEMLEVIRYCPQCGFEVKRGDRFCRNCGAKL